MRGYEEGHGRQGKRSERKSGITEIRGKAILAADYVKRMALSGSTTLSERCRGYGPRQRDIHVFATECHRGQQGEAWKLPEDECEKL